MLFDQMASGQMYDDLMPELIEARIHAVQATNAYNASYGQPPAERERLLREVVGSAGEGATFEPTFRCEFGRNIHLGERFFANFDCVMLDGAPITIGDDVLLGPRSAFTPPTTRSTPANGLRERAGPSRSRSATASGSPEA